jgi:hypothetical protein
MSMYQKALQDVARKHGLSVGDLISRLEAEAAFRGPNGRDVMEDVIRDNVGRTNPFFQTGEAGKPSPEWKPELENRTGWREATPLSDWRRR